MSKKEWVNCIANRLPIALCPQDRSSKDRCEIVNSALVTKGSEVHFRESAFSRPLVIPTHTHPRTIQDAMQLYPVYSSLSSTQNCAPAARHLPPRSQISRRLSPSVSASLECLHSSHRVIVFIAIGYWCARSPPLRTLEFENSF